MTQTGFEHAQGEELASRRLRPWFLVPWMLLVFLILFACGQLALAVRAAPGGTDTRSNLVADYARWQFMPMAPLDPAFLGQLALELGVSGLPPVSDSTVCLLPGSACLPTSTANAPPGTPKPTQPPPGGGGGPTPTATRTVAAFFSSPTPTDPPSGPLPSSTPTLTSTPVTPTLTSTPITPTLTSTPVTPTSTNTPVTPTSTNTPVTPTATSTACPVPAGCEPDVGTPDGGYWTIPPGATAVFNLTSPIIVDGDSDWDLVYYERRNIPNAEILLDLVVVQIGISSTGEWFVVFDWGNGVVDTNTSVSAVPEVPNAPIPLATLYGTAPYQTGILINVDITTVPTGMYDRVSIAGPTPGSGTPAYGAGDRAEVDAVEVLPTPTP